MRIAVIIKEVPDTEARINLAPDGRPDLSSLKFIINPYDDYAIEETVRLAEQHSASTVAICIGGEGSRANLTQALALGIDEAVLLEIQSGTELSSQQKARILAAALRMQKADVVFAGRQGVDFDWGLTGIAVAAELDWAHVGLVSKVELRGQDFRAESEGDDGKLVTEGALPVVFTTDKGINEPRLASLKGIMAAKKKTTTVAGLSDLGLTEAALGTAPLRLLGAALPPAKQPGRIIEGTTAAEKVGHLVDALRAEAKVI